MLHGRNSVHDREIVDSNLLFTLEYLSVSSDLQRNGNKREEI